MPYIPRLAIVLVGMYLPQWKRELGKACTYLLVIYPLICSSVAAGLLLFYREERSTTRIVLQSFIFLSLLPNFIFIVILVPTLVRREKQIDFSRQNGSDVRVCLAVQAMVERARIRSQRLLNAFSRPPCCGPLGMIGQMSTTVSPSTTW